MKDLNIRAIPVGSLEANCYLLWRDGRSDALVIDPGDDLAMIEMLIEAVGRKLTDIVLTHGHFDHILSAAPLAKKYGARIHIHPRDAHMLVDKKASLYSWMTCDMEFMPVEADAMFPDADEWEEEICGIRFKGMRTPGHTKGSVCLIDEEHGVMFTGDTIFAYGCGRTDFPGGSDAEMFKSIMRLKEMDEKLMVYSGHGMKDSMKNIAARWNI